MALKTLNPPIPWRPKPSDTVEVRAHLHLPPRRSVRKLTPLTVSTRIYAGRSGFGSTEDGGVATGREVVPKNADLATLGNLCVDVVLGVQNLPPASKVERRAYMEQLAASPPDKKFWEAGGNCNLTIAASRLGLSCLTLGHVGDEIYGNFLLDVLQDEKITYVGMSTNADDIVRVAAYETLTCWVLVDPFQKHGFCSLADFSEEPAFNWMSELTEEVKTAIRQTKILFCNGYAFDEFFPHLIISSLDCAIHAGTAVFFDPGPRVRKLLHGTLEEKKALELFLRQSDVLLFTSDEIESLTGINNPIKAGQELIRRGVQTKWVVVKMGSKGSILINRSTVSCAPSFKVDVVDTVGCGDSFTAAIAFGFLHGMSAVETLALANAVGAATATGCGAGRNVARLNKVLELLGQSKLNEDDAFWNKLIGKESTDEVLLLSKMSINGHSDRLVRVPIEYVLFQLLPEFDNACERSTI
ncbi:hypothetical protein Cni_G06709 [Canna indica]|uniref:Carbohydrate kinase PfkB domain-containing protein n=1 Tax=Canna indica TaxID=4628 RepID=A0AAQ3JXI7_9LILI|nr:hypothetical protein Cni_G06704 [Canna indica]WOK98001.1 hypothetical protein Cni_G06709 [Canna indica]